METFTPVEMLVYNVLRDGLIHHVDELLDVIAKPEDARKKRTRAKLAVHLCNMRKKIRRISYDVTAEYVNGETYHRLVQFNVGAYR